MARAAVATALFLAFASVAVAEDDIDAETCLGCHAMEGYVGSADEPLFVDGEAFAKSIHSGFGCTGCHSDATTVPHEEKPAKVKPKACATCHAEALRAYLTSVHGAPQPDGNRDSARCASCHGPPHEIRPASDPASPVYPLNLSRTCGACHGDAELAARHGIPIVDAYELYMDSIHGRALTQSGLLVAANCSSCHGTHDIKPREHPDSRVHRTNIPSTCGTCHAGVEQEYVEGKHGVALKAGSETAPVCIDCHTAHQIARVDTDESKLRVLDRCGNCHDESLKTYRDTFHGQVTALGFTPVARCSDCHGSHKVLAASDPDSMVSEKNRVATCGKCHAGSNENFVQFSPHADPHDRNKNPLLYWVTWMMESLIVGVFFFFGLHTTLWFSRSVLERSRQTRRAGRARQRRGKE